MIIISKFSGKCDVYDSLVMIREVKDFSKVIIYAADNEVIPLRINSKKDLIPYYPYLTSIMCGDSEGNTIIHLSKKSFVDAEEEGILGMECIVCILLALILFLLLFIFLVLRIL